MPQLDETDSTFHFKMYFVSLFSLVRCASQNRLDIEIVATASLELYGLKDNDDQTISDLASFSACKKARGTRFRPDTAKSYSEGVTTGCSADTSRIEASGPSPSAYLHRLVQNVDEKSSPNADGYRNTEEKCGIGKKEGIACDPFASGEQFVVTEMQRDVVENLFEKFVNRTLFSLAITVFYLNILRDIKMLCRSPSLLSQQPQPDPLSSRFCFLVSFPFAQHFMLTINVHPSHLL
jgi:hypothetical protein